MRNAALRAACNEYLKRLGHYARVEEREVKDEARVLEAIPSDARLVALTEHGDAVSSTELAGWTERWEREGRDVIFAIGGADALPQDVLARAQQRLSLSRFTLPHELARVVLYEQLYRAHTIRRNEPYHRGS